MEKNNIYWNKWKEYVDTSLDSVDFDGMHKVNELLDVVAYKSEAEEGDVDSSSLELYKATRDLIESMVEYIEDADTSPRKYGCYDSEGYMHKDGGDVHAYIDLYVRAGSPKKAFVSPKLNVVWREKDKYFDVCATYSDQIF